MAFVHDMIGRDAALKDLLKSIELVKDTGHGVSLCLDGDWGCGKTYVLKELEAQLEATTKANIRKKFGPKYYVLHYNCWQHDYYEEPLAAIISVFQEKLHDHLAALGPKDHSEKTYEKADRVLISAFTLICAVLIELAKKQLPLPEDFDKYFSAVKGTGEDVHKILALFKGEKETPYLDSLAPFTEAIRKVQEALDKITEEYTVVFVVDELDRCLPSYAIKVLERLHHLFDQRKKCAVIIATDKKQLSHAIHQCFGSQVDADVYLKKFIHCTYRLVQKKNENGVFRDKYASYFNLFTYKPGEYAYLRSYLIALFADTDMRTQELLFLQTEILHRFLFGNTKKYAAQLLLVEITLTFFAHHEILHNDSCKRDRLMIFPFRVDEKKDIALVYQGMDDFKLYLQSKWQPLMQDETRKWTTQKEDPFFHALVGSCSRIVEGRPSTHQVHLNYNAEHVMDEMSIFAEALRKRW